VRTRELSVLNAIAGALNRSADVESALTRSLELVGQLLGMDSGWVWLLDPESERMYAAATLNLPPYLQQPVQMTGDETCTCIWEFKDGSLRAKNINVMVCSRLRRAVRNNVASETGGLRYHATIPLSFGDRLLGIMNLTGPDWRELTPAELALLDTIAAQVGVAVERARLAEESARLARAEERTRLAREIHDTLAQGLTAIALHVESALRHVEQNPDLVRERLERALDATRENLEEARRSVLNLRATPLAGRSLADALGALGRTLTAETGIRSHLKVVGPGAEHPLPLRIEGELYRVAQEALTNVRRHAHAKSVLMTLRVTPERVSLTVRDDGTGFDAPRARSAGECHGILGMRERAKLLGGRFRLRSIPGRGTLVSISAPLVTEAAVTDALVSMPPSFDGAAAPPVRGEAQ
jgi:two-component system, NarL family, sensor kinase